MPAPREFRRAAAKGRHLFAASVLALLLSGAESLCYGVGPLPQTPCPCAADGICRPNRPSWGYSKTRWRAWPGEQIGQQPTAADGVTPDEGDEQGLPPFEPPLPEQEDLRGLAKEKSDRQADGEADGTGNDDDANPLPGPDELPGLPGLPDFDPEGRNIRDDDAPPALPASLRQAALSKNMPQLATHLRSPTNRLPTSTISTTSTAASTAPTIHPASWHQGAIGLINPAAATVEPDANALQQAIYYEARDLPGNLVAE